MSAVVSEVSRPRPQAVRATPRLDWTLIAGPVVTLAVVLWGITASAYWSDEADTIAAVSRSVPQLFHMLARLDAVHGLYYFLLWPVAKLAGTGEFAARFPSALCMAAAAAGVAAIARRLVSRRAGLCAGLVFALLPTVSAQGQDARPYAAATAAAVLSTYLFIRTVGDPRTRWFTGYGLSLVLLGYLHMFGLLLVVAHVVTLAGLSRRHRAAASGPFTPARRWLVTYAAVGAVMAPLLYLGWQQRGAIAWITKPNWSTVLGAAEILTGCSLLSLIGFCALGAFVMYSGTRLPSVRALTQGGTATGADRMIGWLAVPWLVLPPALLLAVSEFMPVYNSRYITYCLPPVALLVGSGLAALRLRVRVVAFAVVLGLVAPSQLALRTPGEGMLYASHFLSAHERPGDAIVYPYGMIPPWNLAYPEGFAPLRDLSLGQTAGVVNCLYSKPVPLAVLRQRELGVSRIWAVETSRQASNPVAEEIIPQFHQAGRWALPGLTVWLYTKGS